MELFPEIKPHNATALRSKQLIDMLYERYETGGEKKQRAVRSMLEMIGMPNQVSTPPKVMHSEDNSASRIMIAICDDRCIRRGPAETVGVNLVKKILGPTDTEARMGTGYNKTRDFTIMPGAGSIIASIGHVAFATSLLRPWNAVALASGVDARQPQPADIHGLTLPNCELDGGPPVANRSHPFYSFFLRPVLGFPGLIFAPNVGFAILPDENVAALGEDVWAAPKDSRQAFLRIGGNTMSLSLLADCKFGDAFYNHTV